MVAVVSASWARTHFAELLVMVQRQPVEIARHGKTLATLWPVVSKGQRDRERELLYMRRQVPALQRLILHQQMAMRLLSLSDASAMTIAQRAEAELRRMERNRFVSPGHVLRWLWALAKPRVQLAWILVDQGPLGSRLRTRSPIAWVRIAPVDGERVVNRMIEGALAAGVQWTQERELPAIEEVVQHSTEHFGEDWALSKEFPLADGWESGAPENEPEAAAEGTPEGTLEDAPEDGPDDQEYMLGEGIYFGLERSRLMIR